MYLYIFEYLAYIYVQNTHKLLYLLKGTNLSFFSSYIIHGLFCPLTLYGPRVSGSFTSYKIQDLLIVGFGKNTTLATKANITDMVKI